MEEQRPAPLGRRTPICTTDLSPATLGGQQGHSPALPKRDSLPLHLGLGHAEGQPGFPVPCRSPPLQLWASEGCIAQAVRA